MVCYQQMLGKGFLIVGHEAAFSTRSKCPMLEMATLETDRDRHASPSAPPSAATAPRSAQPSLPNPSLPRRGCRPAAKRQAALQDGFRSYPQRIDRRCIRLSRCQECIHVDDQLAQLAYRRVTLA